MNNKLGHFIRLVQKVAFAFVTVLLLGQSALAASTTNKGANPNGKPFIELNGAIVEVEGEVSTLSDQVDALVGEVNSIEARVTANEAAIASLQSTSANLQAQIDDNAADLMSLFDAVALLETANSDLQVQIDAQGDVDGSLQDQIDANDALILANNQAIDSATASLQAQIDNNNNLIAAMEQEIDQINASLAMKQMIVSGTCPSGQNLHEIQADGSVVCEASGGGTSAVTQYRVSQYCSTSYGGCSAIAFCPTGSVLTGGSGYSYYGQQGNGYVYDQPYLTDQSNVDYYNQYYPSDNYGQAWYAYSYSGSYSYNYVYAYAMCLQFN